MQGFLDTLDYVTIDALGDQGWEALGQKLTDTSKVRAFYFSVAPSLFGPLDMKSAGFRAPASNGKVDQPYGHKVKDGEVVAYDPEPAGDNPRAIAPAGGVHCSVTDLARYARLHLTREKNGLLSVESLKYLHTPDEGRDYALGWGVTERKWAGGTALTHTGSNTMFYAVIWLAPEKDFAAVAMCNLGGSEGFERCDKAIALLVSKYLKRGE